MCSGRGSGALMNGNPLASNAAAAAAAPDELFTPDPQRWRHVTKQSMQHEYLYRPRCAVATPGE